MTGDGHEPAQIEEQGGKKENPYVIKTHVFVRQIFVTTRKEICLSSSARLSSFPIPIVISFCITLLSLSNIPAGTHSTETQWRKRSCRRCWGNNTLSVVVEKEPSLCRETSAASTRCRSLLLTETCALNI